MFAIKQFSKIVFYTSYPQALMKKKKEPVCNDELIRKYLEERKNEELYELGGSEI